MVWPAAPLQGFRRDKLLCALRNNSPDITILNNWTIGVCAWGDTSAEYDR
jgi:hypothetical protein